MCGAPSRPCAWGRLPQWRLCCCAPATRASALRCQTHASCCTNPLAATRSGMSQGNAPTEIYVTFLRILQGQVSDIAIHTEEILRMKRALNEIYSKHTGQSTNTIGGSICCLTVSQSLCMPYILSPLLQRTCWRGTTSNRQHRLGILA